MTPPLEAAEARSLFDQQPPLLGLAAEDLLDAALADDRAHLAAEAHVGQELDEIRAPHRRAVDEVLPLAAAVQTPHERDLGERQLGERPVLVVEEELDFAEVGRRPVLASGEEDVVGLLGTQLTRREAPGGPENASDTFDLPEPFGPTTTATPCSRRTSTGSGNDLKPRSLIARRCTRTKSDRALGRQRRRKYGTQNTFEQWTTSSSWTVSLL